MTSAPGQATCNAGTSGGCSADVIPQVWAYGDWIVSSVQCAGCEPIMIEGRQMFKVRPLRASRLQVLPDSCATN